MTRRLQTVPAWVLVGSAFIALYMRAAPAVPADHGFVPVESIQALMLTRVDPSADLLWAAVSSTITAAGTEERQPRTAAEWLALRQSAVSLIEASNLLLERRRPVVEHGRSTDDADVPGIETPQRMQRAIDDDPAAFRKAVSALRVAGMKALSAINAQNPDALIEAGGDLDAACEACHLRFWYPHSPRPPDSPR